MSSIRTWLRWLPLCAGALLLTACDLYPASEYPYTTIDPSTDFGWIIQRLYARVTYITLAVWIVVFGLLGYVIWRFRDDGSPGNPEQVHGNTQLEVGWTLIPIILVLLMVVPTARAIFQIADAAPEDALEIRVIGKRWWWEFQYVESGVTTANEVYIPDDRPVSFLLESDSVIHSFWVPRLGGKRDLVPGRVNRLWFNLEDDIQPGQPETYLGECAEYCGEAHALMRFRTIALDGPEFDQWLVDMQNPPEIADASVKARGEEAFAQGGCIACHAVTGNEQATGNIGPDLTRFGIRQTLAAGTVPNTPENLAQWLRDVDSVKPGTTGRFDGMNIPVELSDEQIDALVAYLHALK